MGMHRATGFGVEVHDEGHYWETRDVAVLAKHINESTEMIAAMAETLKAAAARHGLTVESPIETSKNYVNVAPATAREADPK
jgi:hypothetical protein